ncbi:hypothetical protein PGQ11_003777 [Apiospora arundinis]|uniref:Uncharacterized protein n=1 Tax=Apiospora arundinis TaxID=335852 RepID=A0ABR2J6U9_9PEZI
MLHVPDITTLLAYLSFLLIVVMKQLLDSRTLGDPPAPAQKTAVASAVPEALSEADALVATAHDLTTHLADGQIDYGVIACLAGEARGPAQDMRRSPREVPAECAGEEVGMGRTNSLRLQRHCSITVTYQTKCLSPERSWRQ